MRRVDDGEGLFFVIHNDFLLELLSEEIPARMQSRARNDLAKLFAERMAQAGLSHGDTASGLSQLLPGLVDKLTPNGQMPQQDSLQEMLGSLGIGK